MITSSFYKTIPWTNIWPQSCANLICLYPYKNLKLFRTDASKRLTPAPLNKISLTLSHESVLSVTTITISVLSLTSTPLSAVAQSVQGSRWPGSAVLRSSSVSWNGSVGRRRDNGSNLSSPSTNRYESIKQKVTNFVDKTKQAYYSAKIQSSTTALSELQHHPRQKQIFTSYFNIWLWRPSGSLFWLLHWENLHHQKQFSSSKPNCLTSFAGNPLLTFEPVTDLSQK